MTEKSNLIKGKRFWEVELKTRNGTTKFPILEKAKCFREEDAQEGATVNVIRKNGLLIKVTIEGKPEYNPTKARKSRKTKAMQQASPEVLAESFYNPYTFVPFSESPVMEKISHIPHSADDEINAGYFTGIIRLKVKTESPLMSRDHEKVNENNHKMYSMLKIGDHVVVPSTAVKGFLRNLTTILSGGPLNTIDENACLCQGRKGGKKSVPMLDKIKPEHVKPEWMSNGAHIHPVTNMFGLGSQSPKYQDGLSVASKLRFDNLVFNQDVEILPRQPIAVLASPNPGCLAFYRDNEDPKSISSEDYLKGYKVYRTTKETDKAGPWNYDDIQPIYKNGGMDIIPADTRENVFSSELLAPGAKGDLEIAFRSLTYDELSLLIAACKVPWRLGGGKPLGLGLCRIIGRELKLDDFESKRLVDFESSLLVDKKQMDYWIASQKPVDKLRYPRAVITNKSRTSRGGHHWFSKMAKPKQEKKSGASFKGLRPIYSTGDLKTKADKNIKHNESYNEHENEKVTPVSGTVLPRLNPDDPSADKLYGYDIHFDEERRIKEKCYKDLKKFSG